MLDDTIEELRAVALGADDASGYFPAMYARVTERIQSAAAEGRFGDGQAMERFARAFAAWYLLPHAGDRPLPGCWRAAADVAGDGHLLIVQHLLLGINAHVNHDLPQVVVELAEASGDLDGLRHDFDAVNDVLGETLPMVLHDLGRVSRWVNVVAARGGQRLFAFSLRAARNQAWSAAGRLYALDPAERSAAAAELDAVVRVLAYLIANPGRPMSWFVAVGRRLEERDPRTVTAQLLGHLR